MKSFKLIGKFKLIAFMIILFSCSQLIAQTDPDFEWVRNLGGSLTDEIKDVVTDNQGNIIVTGSFDTFMSIGGINLASSGGSDVFVAKFDNNGNVIWARQGGSGNYDVGHSVIIDNNGDIIITGIYNGDALFGTFSLPARGGYDIFIAKYTADGNIIWADRAGGQGFEFVEQVDIDNLNNIYITGTYEGVAIFDTISVSTIESTNIYTAKYNSNGDVQWVRIGETNSFSSGSYGLAVSSNNEVYIAGSFDSPINFSGTLLTGQQGNDIFLVKYNSDGGLIWAIQAAGLSSSDQARDVFVDKDDFVYVTGSFGQSVSFGNFNLTASAQSDIFIVKYTPQGDPVWAAQDGQQVFDNSGVGVVADDGGNVAVISEVSQIVGSGEVNDLYISRYNSDGQKIWGYIIGSQGSDYAGKITTDVNGDIIAAGRFYESGTFGTKPLTGNGFHDAFFGKVPTPRFFVPDNTIAFGNVAIGSTREIGLTIRNTANTTLHFYNSVIGGNDASVFSFSPSPFSIGPLDSLTLLVGFSPLTSGIKSAHILFESDSPFNPDTVFLTGSAGDVSILLSTSLLDFGSVDTSGSTERTVTVSNVGSATAVIHLPLIFGLNQSDFSVNNVQTFPDTLQPQETKNITLTFSPGALGVRSANLQILSNAPSSPDLVSLQGRGTAAAAIITLSTSLLDFGTVDINNFSERVLTITNTGSLPTVIDSASVLPPGNTDFSVVTPNFPLTLEPEEVSNITLRFSPTTSGDKLAQLNIVSNAVSSPDLVDLEGNAVTGIVVGLPPSPQLGQTINLNVSPPPGFEATGGTIFYRQAGEQSYSNSILTLQDTMYITSIPPQFSTIKGIEFYIVFTDGLNTVSYPTTNPATQPAILQINVPVFPFQGLIPDAEYRMVSIPLTINNPDILSVFGDDYGQYDSTLWRVFRWNSVQNNYDEFPDIASDITPGNAFWLINRQGTSFDIENAVSVQTSNDFTINLPANSWTQLGNPFAFPVDWTIIDTASLVNLPISWNPDSLDYELNQTILEPWDGYWVRNPLNQVVTLNIPPIRFIEEKSLPKESLSIAAGEFIVQIRSGIEGSKIIDNQNFVGMVNENNFVYGKNVPEPPSIHNKLQLSIIDSEKSFAQNTVRENSDGTIWYLRIKTTLYDKNVKLSFNLINQLPEGFNLYLIDVDRQTAISLNDFQTSLKISDHQIINLKLIIGTQKFAENNSDNIPLTPTDYVVHQNYPNPFNPITTISYNLKEKSIVSIEVYDILGNRIITLIDNKQQNSGIHSVVWNGVNTNGVSVSSGVYIYKIRANEFTASRKMILLK